MAGLTKETEAGILAQVNPWWHPFMEQCFTRPEFINIIRHVVMDRNRLCPKTTEIFRVLMMPPEKVKVVVIGQDPYILGEAHGLAFSSQLGITPSLREIFNEIARTEGKLRTRFRLDDWEEQGVFLINTNLTTVMRRSLAHNDIGWQWFTGRVLDKLNASGQFIVLAWGTHARKMAKLHMRGQIIMEWTHPAARLQEFTGNNHFRAANAILWTGGQGPVDWAGPDYKPVLKPEFHDDDEEIPDVPPPDHSNADSPAE